MSSFTATPPPVLKPIVGILKTASDHEKLDSVVTYWCRLYALQLGLQIDDKSKESLAFLTTMMLWLEEKKAKGKEEAISNEIVAQAHLENHAMKLFVRADNADRAGQGDRNVAKLFYTSSQIFDTLKVFGELTEEVSQKSKYAKWRTAYITKCIKNGEIPQPPPNDSDENVEDQPNLGPTSSVAGPSSSNTAPYPTSQIEGQPTPPYPSHTEDPFAKFNKDTGNNSSSLNNSNSNSSVSTPKPFEPSSSKESSCSSFPASASALNGATLGPQSLLQAQKYCKWAGSALQYEDVNTAVRNLEKALHLLKTGTEI